MQNIIAHDLCGGFCHECTKIDYSTSYVEGVKGWEHNHENNVDYAQIESVE
jgi:hypothetical protein